MGFLSRGTLHNFDRLSYQRNFLFLGALLLPTFGFLFDPNLNSSLIPSARSMFGYFCLLLFVLSFLSVWVSRNLSNILAPVSAVGILNMSYSLYSSSFLMEWLLLYIILYVALGTLIFSRTIFVIYSVFSTSCFIVALYLAKDVPYDKGAIAFLFISLALIMLVMVNTFQVNIMKLEQSKTLLEEKNKMVRKMANTNAHNIRGPLARILGLTYLFSIEEESVDQLIPKISTEARNLDDEVKATQRFLESLEKDL